MNNSNYNNSVNTEKDPVEFEVFMEATKKNYTPDEMLTIWLFRLNESLKSINDTLKTIASEKGKLQEF